MNLSYRLRTVGIPGANGSFRGVIPLQNVDINSIGMNADDVRQLNYLWGVFYEKLMVALSEGKRVSFFGLTFEPGLSGSVPNNLGTFDNTSIEVRAKVKSSMSNDLRARVTMVRDDTPPSGPFIQAVLSDVAFENYLGLETVSIVGRGLKGNSYSLELVQAGGASGSGLNLTQYVAKITDTRVLVKLPDLSVVLTALNAVSAGPNELLYRVNGTDLNPFPCEAGPTHGLTSGLIENSLYIKRMGGFTLGGVAKTFITSYPASTVTFELLDDESARFRVNVYIGGNDDLLGTLTDYVASLTVEESGFALVKIPFADPLPDGYTSPVSVDGGDNCAYLAIPRSLLGASVEKGYEFRTTYPSR